MKLGTGSDSVNSISFRVDLGFNAPGNNEKDHKKVLKFIDQTTETIDYGSRKTQTANCVLKDIDKDDYITLINYLDASQGSKIRIEQEFTGENIFTSVIPSQTYYAYLIAFEGQGEQDFSGLRSRFDCSLTLAYVGINESDELNLDDSSLIDVLIEVDTVRADFVDNYNGTFPTGSNGQRLLDTFDNKVYKYIDGSWTYLYDLMSNNPTYGFVNGVFYWSLFSDISQDVSNSINQNYVSGFINKNSLSLPKKSINLFNGPAIAYKKGFSFSVRNVEPFWAWVISNKISLYSSKITAKLFNKDGPNKYLSKIADGLNNTNSFSYKDYAFRVEPKILNDQSKYNSDLIYDDVNGRYEDIRADLNSKPEYRTYGIWENAALQNVSKDFLQVEFREGGELYNTIYIIGTQGLNGSEYTYIKVPRGSGSGEYLIDNSHVSGLINFPEYYAIKVLDDSNTSTSNVGVTVPIIAYSGVGSEYTFTLAYELPTDPNSSSLVFTIIRNSFLYQAGNESSGGFGDQLSVKTYNKEKTDLENIPTSGLQVNPNNLNDNTTIQLNSAESSNLDGIISYNSTESLSPDIIPKTYDYLISGPNTGNVSEDNIFGIFPYNSKTYSKICYHDNPGLPNTTESSYLAFLTYFTRIAFYDDTIDIPKQTINKLTGETVNHTGGSFGASIDFESSNNGSDLTVGRFINGVKIPINHSNDGVFENSDQIRLCLDLYIRNYIEIRGKYSITEGTLYRSHHPFSYKVVVRFKTINGTYIEDSNWVKSVNAKNGGYSNNLNDLGKFYINNYPDGDYLSGGFGVNTSSLVDNFDFIIRAKTSLTVLNAYAVSGILAYGDLVYDETNDTFRYCDNTSTTKVLTTQPVDGDKILLYNHVDGIRIVYTVDSSGHISDPGSQETNINTLKGRDLFDISSLFGVSPQWPLVESMEILMVSDDFEDVVNYSFGSPLYFEDEDQHSINFAMTIRKTPILFYGDEFSLDDKKLFANFTGADLGGGEYSDATAMVKYILNETFGSKYDSNSVDNLMSGRNWNFRNQFYDTIDNDNVLKQILWATFSCAVYDKYDKIVLKSLSESSYTSGGTSYNFHDSDIIDGSISVVKMREADEIFQKFKFSYNFNPPGKFSSSIDEYLNSEEVSISKPLNNDIKELITISEALFENENFLEKNIEYHYELNSMEELLNLIVRNFLFNAWEVSFSVPISRFLNGSEIDCMNYIGLSSSFHTNGQLVKGFVSGLNFDVYKGVVKIRMYIPNPPGVTGPFNIDIFKDALFITFRDVTIWQANGQINDGGQINTRSGVFNDDAGQVSVRNFNEW